MQFVELKRHYLKLTRTSVKVYCARYAPHLVKKYSKHHNPAQQTLFEPTPTIRLTWKSEVVNLVELGAALSEVKAFGPNVTRKDIWQALSLAFQLPLERPESALSQLKQRKIQPVRFLDSLRASMIELIDRGMD